MSDGPSDCARNAESRAERFVKAKFPDVKLILSPSHAPKTGKVAVVYEEWLSHVIEVIVDRRVTERYLVEPSFVDPDKPPKRMPIGKEDWPVGYYQDHSIPRRSQ